MRTFLNFVRTLPGLEELEERVARQLPSAFALTAEPKREWVLACWLEDLTSDRITSPAWEWGINPRPTAPGPQPPHTWFNSLGDVGRNVLQDVIHRAAIAEWLESRLAFPNLDYDRAPPGFEKEKPEKRVLLRIVFPRLPKPGEEELSQARSIIVNLPVPCVIEFRANPGLALQPGSGLIPPGTIGGLVRDGVGRVYAVTCGHVVAPLVRADGGDRRVRDQRGELVGELVRAVIPIRSPTGHVCTRQRSLPGQPLPTGDPFANLLDVALVQANGALPMTGFRDLFSNFDSGTRVQMAGAVSGTADYVVEAVNLWTKFPAENPNELPYCFQDLFQFGPLSENWIGRMLQVLQGSRVANLVATAPKRGDSGAWITSGAIHGVPDWLGMLIGVSDSLGYAVMSDVIWSWICKELPAPVAVH
jgi:hypothetical protein